MSIETAIELEDSEKTTEDLEMKKRKMVVYKFFLDSREHGMEDKTKQINRMLSINAGTRWAETRTMNIVRGDKNEQKKDSWPTKLGYEEVRRV